MPSILIIGAGLSGCVIAEYYARNGYSVTVYEKRPHIAGNCYDYRDSEGILINQYGPHIFHTSSERVWNYVNQFSKWIPWKHLCYGIHKDKYFPIPINITTVNTVYDLNLKTEDEMREFLSSRCTHITDPANSKELALSRFGKELYETVIEGYTTKQWNRDPSELDASVVNRIPIRYSFEEGYFSDPYQALPENGYTEFCKKLLSHPSIEVKLSTDFTKELVDRTLYEKIFYTGPIDAYFSESGLPQLEYRSLRFEIEQLDMEWFQKNSIVNYTDKDIPYTRIVEYKHFMIDPSSKKTTIVREYPSSEGEPYYPIPNKKNQDLYEQYKQLAEKEERNQVYFVGRLANYKYFNMDNTILNALELLDRIG